MIEKNARLTKQKNYKTEPFYELESSGFELGKPIVRLPIISKKSTLRFQPEINLDKSLDSKEKPTNNKFSSSNQEDDFILRKFSNNSQLQLLSFEELQLCGDKSKKMLPKIVIGSHSRQNTDRAPSDQFYKRMHRMKSEKNIDSVINNLGPYRMASILGRGNYSIVKLCETADGKRYAVKVYGKKKINCVEREQNLAEEISILESIQHCNIIRFKEHVQTQENHYIFMELFDNISLLDFVKKQQVSNQKDSSSKHLQMVTESNTARFREKPRLDQPVACMIVKQLFDAFLYLHSKGIAHRDVKLQNVLIGSQSKDHLIIKVIDFGFSRHVFPKQAADTCAETKQNKSQTLRKKNSSEQSLFYDFCGTPSYISPEIIEKKGYRARPADVWALGVLIFYLVTGHFPFKNVNQKSQFKYSIYQDLPNIDLSPSLVSMLQKMLRNDPKSRPTIAELLKEDWVHTAA